MKLPSLVRNGAKQRVVDLVLAVLLLQDDQGFKAPTLEAQPQTPPTTVPQKLKTKTLASVDTPIRHPHVLPAHTKVQLVLQSHSFISKGGGGTLPKIFEELGAAHATQNVQSPTFTPEPKFHFLGWGWGDHTPPEMSLAFALGGGRASSSFFPA